MNDRRPTPAPRTLTLTGRHALALGACLLIGTGTAALAGGTGGPAGERPKADPAKILERLDTNRDGVLTPDDIVDDQRGDRLLRRLERLDSDADGQVTLAELELARQHSARQARPGRRPGPEERFEAKDTDQDGRLSWAEFRGDGRLFARIDDDGDGRILRAELGEGERAGRKLKRFDRLDSNHDGELTRAEVETVQLERFASLDTDGDGFLGLEELRSRRRGRGDNRDL